MPGQENNAAAVCLLGPTASGKTELALELAARYPFEIVSVDSAMVYRGMDIGTAKPDPGILAQYPHHLIDIRDPAEAYSAAMFRSDALRIMQDIFSRGRIPLLTGGTMLYVKALRDGLADLPAADQAVRTRINDLANREGWPAVHRRLAEVDATTAARLSENDSSRLQRALEVFEISGTPISVLQAAGQQACPFPLLQLAIVPNDRAALHARIESRFTRMIQAGLVDEVKGLFERGDLSDSLPAIRAVGYRQVWQYLAGESGFDEMMVRGVVATRQLAKRQYTWLRSWPDLHVIDEPDITAALKIIRSGSILGESGAGLRP
ncbi:MAG: tRNA (adenosine(37)-N6)-dimethylallyltransferase MiaA [Pseudomonadota bacterium]